MSALGQKRTFGPFIATSALPPKADIAGRQLDVRFVPIAEVEPLYSITSSATSFWLVGANVAKLLWAMNKASLSSRTFRMRPRFVGEAFDCVGSQF
jgi:hypothetical protein